MKGLVEGKNEWPIVLYILEMIELVDVGPSVFPAIGHVLFAVRIPCEKKDGHEENEKRKKKKEK